MYICIYTSYRQATPLSVQHAMYQDLKVICLMFEVKFAENRLPGDDKCFINKLVCKVESFCLIISGKYHTSTGTIGILTPSGADRGLTRQRFLCLFHEENFYRLVEKNFSCDDQTLKYIKCFLSKLPITQYTQTECVTLANIYKLHIYLHHW